MLLLIMLYTTTELGRRVKTWPLTKIFGYLAEGFIRPTTKTDYTYEEKLVNDYFKRKSCQWNNNNNKKKHNIQYKNWSVVTTKQEEQMKNSL